MAEVKFVLFMTPAPQPDADADRQALALVLRQTCPDALDSQSLQAAAVWATQPRDDDHLMEKAHEVFGSAFLGLDMGTHDFTAYAVQDVAGMFGQGSRILVVREKSRPVLLPLPPPSPPRLPPSAPRLEPLPLLRHAPRPQPAPPPAPVSDRDAHRAIQADMARRARLRKKGTRWYHVLLALTGGVAVFLFVFHFQRFLDLFAVAWAFGTLYLMRRPGKILGEPVMSAWLGIVGAGGLLAAWAWWGCPYSHVAFWEIPWSEFELEVLLRETPGVELFLWQALWPATFVLNLLGAAADEPD